MMASRVYTKFSRIDDEEWYSKIRQAAIQAEETQGQFVIKYQELLPLDYATYLDCCDIMSHQDKFKRYVNFDLKIPENEQNLSEVWNFLKIPTVDWYIGCSVLKLFTDEHYRISPMIAPFFVWSSDSKIRTVVKRLKSLPSSVISEETFDEFISKTLNIPPEEQDTRVWAFLQSINLYFKFWELYLLLKVAAVQDEDASGLDFIRIADLRKFHDKEDLSNWGYFSQGSLSRNITIGN